MLNKFSEHNIFYLNYNFFSIQYNMVPSYSIKKKEAFTDCKV
jgi:hypothetical protein